MGPTTGDQARICTKLIRDLLHLRLEGRVCSAMQNFSVRLCVKLGLLAPSLRPSAGILHNLSEISMHLRVYRERESNEEWKTATAGPRNMRGR